MIFVRLNVWCFITEKPELHTFLEQLFPVSARTVHFHDDGIWLQRPEFISFFLFYLKMSILLKFENNSLNLHKKTTNWDILVVVVKWRHRAIVLFRILSFQVGEQYRLDVFIAERFKCDSNLFVQTSGVHFVRHWEEILPVDYKADVSENTQVGSLLQVWC